MRITCRDCHAEFFLPTSGSVPPKAGGCPFCGGKFAVVETGEPGVRRVSFESEQTIRRICINCTKEFVSDKEDVIPICSDCRTQERKAAQPEKPRIWKVFRAAGQVELDSENSVREWIRQGDISPDDKVVSPYGKVASAKRFSEFAEAFRGQRERQSSPGASMPVASKLRRRLHFVPLAKFAGLLLVAFTLGWFAYRALTFTAPKGLDDPTLTHLVEELKKRVDSPAFSPDKLLALAVAALEADESERYLEARTLSEQAVIAEPSAERHLLLLAQAYGYAAAFGDDASMRLVAMDLADLAIRLIPTNAGGYLAKARAALSSGNRSVAEQFSQRAMELDPGDPWVKLTRARTLLAWPDPPTRLEEAMAIADAVLQAQPTLLEAYDILGSVRMLTAEPDHAAQAFERRMAQAPSDALALYRMGELELQGENFEAARDWFIQALRASPFSVSSRLELAILRNRVEAKPRLAERHLREILTRYRRYATPSELGAAYRELMHVLSVTERAAEAEDLAGELAKVSDQPALDILAKAQAFRAAGKHEQAATLLSDFLANDAGSAPNQLELARAFVSRDDVENAKKAYREVFSLRPLWLVPQLELVSLFVSKERFDEALDVSTAMASRSTLLEGNDLRRPFVEPANPGSWDPAIQSLRSLAKHRPESAVAHAALGAILLRTRVKADVRMARTSLQKATQLDKNSEFWWLQLGRAQLELNEVAEAWNSFRTAQRLNPTGAAAQYWLGRLQMAKKQWSEAEKTLETAVADNDWGVAALVALGDIHRLNGQLEKAREDWRKALTREPRSIPAWRALLNHRNS